MLADVCDGTIGVYLGMNSVTTISGTVIDGNYDGLDATSNAKSLIDGCSVITNSGDGISIDAGVWGRINDTTITNNQGWGITNSGFARTFGTNRIANNAAGNTNGSIIVIGLQ
jgi:hypothetical protein